MSRHIWSRVTMRWSQLVFGEKIQALTPKVRMLRLLEETLELAQAEGVNIGEVRLITDQVFKKPPGEPYKELGGVLVTMAVYAETKGYDIDCAFWDEFERIMDPVMMEKVRKRNLEGDKIGIKGAK